MDSSDFVSNIDKVPGDFPINEPETVDMEEILSTLPIRKTPPDATSSLLSEFTGKNLGGKCNFFLLCFEKKNIFILTTKKMKMLLKK